MSCLTSPPSLLRGAYSPGGGHWPDGLLSSWNGISTAPQPHTIPTTTATPPPEAFCLTLKCQLGRDEAGRGDCGNPPPHHHHLPLQLPLPGEDPSADHQPNLHHSHCLPCSRLRGRWRTPKIPQWPPAKRCRSASRRAPVIKT